MARARRGRRAAFVAIAALGLVSACNALTGAHDRRLDEDPTDAARIPRPDASRDATVDAELPVDSSTGVVFVDVSRVFTSPNGALTTTTDAGISITTATGASHPVIVPSPQPNITAEDYTVYATVLAPTNGEFGILTRLQADGGGAVVFGSKFGGENKPFFGSFSPPDYNPTLDVLGPAYTYTPNERFKFTLKAVGNQITGKFWDATMPEPASFQISFIAPYATGRGIGFYTYTVNGAVLESLRVSIP